MSAVVKHRKPFGRPRILSFEQVVRAGCEIGLERLDMTMLARKLGIGIATLYGYVEGRDHLVRLVAARLAATAAVQDRGQPWDAAIREHADAVYRSYRECPQLLMRQAEGAVGDPAASEAPNALLSLMIARGMTPREALLLYSQALQAVSGAALAAACYDRLVAEAGGEDAFLDGLGERCDANGFAGLSACLSAADLQGAASDYGPALERLIAEQKERMGPATV